MIRHEFDQAFFPMSQALLGGSKIHVTKLQADYFWEEFRSVDQRDFSSACSELAMGNPGYLPKLSLFREYVAGAREMRMEQMKAQEKKESGKFFAGQIKINKRDPIEESFCKLNYKIIVGGVAETASALIPRWLEDPKSERWARARYSNAGSTETIYDCLMRLLSDYPGTGVE